MMSELLWAYEVRRPTPIKVLIPTSQKYQDTLYGPNSSKILLTIETFVSLIVQVLLVTDTG
jgi:hypothetical protein